MTAVWLRRTVGGVAPFDHADLPDNWKVGDALLADIRKPRNGKLHRKAFVLIDKVWPHTEYTNKEALRKAMTIAAEFVEPIVNPLTGEVSLAPKSWEFSSMDDLEFSELYSRLIDVALVIVPNSTRDDWEQAVDDIVRM